MGHVARDVRMRVYLFCTVAERYIRVFRSRFAVRRHLCLAFFVRASRFAVRASRFAVRGSCFAVRGSQSFVPRISRSCFAVRAFSFAVRTFSFVLRSSQFAVRGSWFVVVLEQGGGSIYHRLFLRRKCAE